MKFGAIVSTMLREIRREAVEDPRAVEVRRLRLALELIAHDSGTFPPICLGCTDKNCPFPKWTYEESGRFRKIARDALQTPSPKE